MQAISLNLSMSVKTTNRSWSMQKERTTWEKESLSVMLKPWSPTTTGKLFCIAEEAIGPLWQLMLFRRWVTQTFFP